MPSTPDDPNTTAMLDNLFATLRSYSQTSKVTEADQLRQRARQYATAQRQTAPGGVRLTMITFQLGGERYGLDVGVVRSVRPLPAITRVPNVPSFFMGVANVRGVVLTLLDLRRFFDLPPADKLAELIVVTHGDLTLGLPVGRVLEVQTIPKDAINGLEEVRYTLGAYVLGRERLVILDADDILTDSRLIHTNEANHD